MPTLLGWTCGLNFKENVFHHQNMLGRGWSHKFGGFDLLALCEKVPLCIMFFLITKDFDTALPIGIELECIWESTTLPWKIFLLAMYIFRRSL